MTKTLHIWLVSKNLFISVLFAFCIFFVISLNAEPTIYTGRDQGTLFTAAQYLVVDGKIGHSSDVVSSFHSIYGSGPALNFPGFYYSATGELVAQFPYVYIAYVAAFVMMFGTSGIAVANSVALSLFVGTFYLCVREFCTRRISMLGIGFILLSFVYIWFVRYSLSEILAVVLVWILLWSVLRARAHESRGLLALALLSGSLLVFARVEGIVIAGIAALVLFFSEKPFFIIRRRPILYTMLPLLCVIFIFALSFPVLEPFVRAVSKAILDMGNSTIDSTESSDSHGVHLLIYAIYGLLPHMIGGIIIILTLFWRRSYTALIPFILVAPVFFYLYDPQISDDHPWMLRRVTFAVYPVLLFYTVLGLQMLHSKTAQNYNRRFAHAAVLVLFFLIGSWQALPIVHFAQIDLHADLRDQTERLAQNFSDDDLLLIDKNAAGDNFSMLAGPLESLYHREAVYFFNPEDLKKLEKVGELDTYSAIFLIVPTQNTERYTSSSIGSALEEYDQIYIQTEHLNRQDTLALPPRLPRKHEQKVENIVYRVNTDKL
jgi:hypothetical protein